MGVAPLVWEAIITWADKFYGVDRIVMVPKKSVKTTEKILRGKPTVITETIVEDFPVVVKCSALEGYELEIIMQLSREYCDEYSAAADPQRECPKEIFLDEVDAMENADAIQDMFMKNWGVNRDMKPTVEPLKV